MANDDNSRPPASAQQALYAPRRDRMTSGGLRVREVRPAVRHEVKKIDGMDGAANGLPSLDAVLVPSVLCDLPRQHPGSQPRSGWHRAVWADAEDGWTAGTIALPPELRVSSRNDIV